MSRKTKTLIGIFGVLVLLGGGYFGSTVWKKKKAEAAWSNTPSPRLGNLESFNLVKIEVPGIVLEKKDDVWELVSLNGDIPPAEIELDQSQVTTMTYYLASVWVERIVDEEPADLSVYGLDMPGTRAIVTDSDGKRAEYMLGDMTPSRTAYYVMEEGDPKVYIIPSYSAENMGFSLGKIRKKSLPALQLQLLARMLLEKDGKRIDISIKPELVPPYLASSFSAFIMTAPFKLVRGVDSETFYELLRPYAGGLQMENFIEDFPSSLSPYGLDNPVRFFLETGGGDLDLLIGSRQADGTHYAKLADAPGVFTVKGLESVVNARPFALVEKFALLINIDLVDKLSITGGEKNLDADFQGTGDEAVFFLNGKKAETSSFKNWYQAVVSLYADAEIPASSGVPSGASGEISVEYRLNTPPGERVSVTLVPFNRDFYALKQEGTTEFLISRNQVRRIYDAADAVIFE